MLVKNYVYYWYNTFAKINQTTTTIQITENNIRTHIAPSALGHMEITKVQLKDLQSFLIELLTHGNKCPLHNIHSYGKPLSHWTVRKIRQILINAFQLAVKETLIPYNYATDTTPISVPMSTVIPFTIIQQKKILNITRNHRHHAAYMLCFYCGCRRGEILGLSWNNVHFTENYIFISQTLIMENNEPTLKKNHAKTSKSLRAIPIPKDLKFELHDVKKRQLQEKQALGKNWKNHDNLVFTNKDGSPVNPNYFSRNFKQCLKRHGFPKELHLHNTRHSWSTNLVQLGVPIPDIQAMGGWSRPDVLLTIYAQTVQKTHKKAIQKLYNACQ